MANVFILKIFLSFKPNFFFVLLKFKTENLKFTNFINFTESKNKKEVKNLLVNTEKTVNTEGQKFKKQQRSNRTDLVVELAENKWR